ncbi:hypothetical protein PHYC_00840 [Phycisphaerales bacterium]|nr:hypothetical protein PHYC_00840 [Phycisphaerales bacterium]
MDMRSGALGLLLGLAVAQAQPPAPQPPPQGIPPQVKLGQRVEATRRAASASETLIIVRDAASYIEAISRWTPTRRFPVLIDDGTLESRDHIALFARAFAPKQTLRWSKDGNTEAPFSEAGFARIDVTALTTAQSRAWGLVGEHPSDEALLAHWKASGHQPPGVVVIGLDDPAWTAGLALAAGRGQPLVFVKARQGIDSTFGAPETDALLRAIELGAESTGLPWRGLGDSLDAVTLCLNTPNRYDTGKEALAMSDRIGRLGDAATPTQRWAWCGQIFGSPARAAYWAMCSLFLQPDSSWVFDGYPDTPPWNTFDGAKVADYSKRVGFNTELLDSPRGGAADWRARVARPVGAGLIFVNTKGNDDFFDLEPGQCKPGDVPILSTPAAAVFVHSWSALSAGKRDRICGRWLERGVFLYMGSVHEPFLQGFVPTPVVAARLLSGAPFGAAVRNEPAPWWKITVLGDPLYTVGPMAKRVADAPIFDGARDVQEHLRDLLTAEDFSPAMTAMSLAGRDADVARLASALIATRPHKLTPEVAACAVLPLFRAGETADVWKAFARLAPASQRDPIYRDALWLSAGPLLDGRPDEPLLTLLKANTRSYQGLRDAMLLARAWQSTLGMDSALAMLRDIRARLPDAKSQEELDLATRAPPEGWGR